MDIVIGLGGGLGNKLHTLYGAHYLTMYYGMQFRYAWYEYNCMFWHIFDDARIQIVPKPCEPERVEIYNNLLTREDMQQKVYWGAPFHPHLTNSPVVPDLAIPFNDIKIQPDMLQAIAAVSIPANTIGVHIRGGDIKSGIEEKRPYVPPAEFFPTIDQFLAQNPNQMFFLSCEDEEDETKLLARYNPQQFIRLANCERSRISIQGVKDAFVNMVLLSKCATIVGMRSSFSDLAARIGHVRQITLKKQNAPL
jgi:hypothetical protein